MKKISGIAAVTAIGFLSAGSDIQMQKTVSGKWNFTIITTEGQGMNVLMFSGTGTSGLFQDQYGHGGPWRVDNGTDSIYWEYTSGETLPKGLINKIAGKLNADYTIINAVSSGVYNGKPFTGKWAGLKAE